ncbi:MAG: beta-ketoacyl synthase chain length factor [Bacteroidales bacterium]|nr:beta-ketoacyl synthase chain length factor [Bacteroidales bacterium]
MFISDLLCISHQKTYDLDLFNNGPIYNEGIKYFALEPDYTSLIPASTLRRMGKFMRMGVGTGLPMLQKHIGVEGIILATANGGVDDSMKFLNQIEKYQEGTLTPTNFVQSTPNSLAGTLSMMCNNKGYNNTHVHEGLAFENALLDAQMFLESNKTKVLLGAAEEISDWNFNINLLKGRFKKENCNPESLLESGTIGTVCGEGAFMFVIEATQRNVLAQIKDVGQITTENPAEIFELLRNFLKKNNMKPSDVDAIMLGYNGDARTDSLYNDFYNSMFKGKAAFCFKNLCGEFPTASAFALWLATYIINTYPIPDKVIKVKPQKEINNILIYNHYNGLQHGMILLNKAN